MSALEGTQIIEFQQTADTCYAEKIAEFRHQHAEIVFCSEWPDPYLSRAWVGPFLLVQVTKHGGYVAFESLDGKFLYFAKELGQTTLWRVPVDGGEETRILGSVVGQAFAPGRKGVYFVAPRTDGTSAVQLLSFATGKVTTIAVIHRPTGWGLSVSPDERFILYTQFDQEGSNLMLVENFR